MPIWVDAAGGGIGRQPWAAVVEGWIGDSLECGSPRLLRAQSFRATLSGRHHPQRINDRSGGLAQVVLVSTFERVTEAAKSEMARLARDARVAPVAVDRMVAPSLKQVDSSSSFATTLESVDVVEVATQPMPVM